MMKKHRKVKIDKGIPMTRHRSGRNGFYPYFEMKVGDSFLCPSDVAPNTAYGIAREGNRRAILGEKPHRFKAGKTDKGYRCWRIE
jgi:hypothetical protein